MKLTMNKGTTQYGEPGTKGPARCVTKSGPLKLCVEIAHVQNSYWTADVNRMLRNPYDPPYF